MKVRTGILDRFSEFQKKTTKGLCFPTKGIFEEKGCYVDTIKKENVNIGIIGVNTAWLSKSDQDEKKLSPGKYMLEEALNALNNCEYKIVLGHHPLSWFHDEQKKQICALLGKSKAMYLHGHMHKDSMEYFLIQSTGFLTLQCGAAFLAREDEKYYNSLQWGEIDLTESLVRITPKRWSSTNQMFIPDISENMPELFREEGKDSWLFHYTFTVSGTKKADGGTGLPEKMTIKVPEGWHWIDKTYIDQRKEAQDEDILKYFDGKEPSYSGIFSGAIPTRGIVHDIVREYIRCNEDQKIKCVLLTGAGGEGKTTVLLQVVRALAEEHGWGVLRLTQVDKGANLYEEAILKITQEGNWLICADNCFLVADKLFKLLKRLANRDSRNTHLLLCSRDTDWKNSEADKLTWGDYADLKIRKLRGISPEDAALVVAAWNRYGEKGLGKLEGLGLEEAKNKLVRFSKDEEAKNDSDEGAFLGAMLMTRYGDGLYSHIRDMLNRLQAVPLGTEGNLLEAFSYIVAMHSRKLYFLSKVVIAKVYNMEWGSVKKKILTPLGDEAACTVNGEMIFTRHISIAKAAWKILDEEFGVEFDKIYVDLARAALEAKRSGAFVAGLEKWRYLSKYFVEDNASLAISLDQEILRLEPFNPYVMVHLSKSYRDVEQPEQAMEMFRSIGYELRHRSLFCEWALVEAIMDNKAASVCLSAIALSDQAEEKQINVENACINLYSIAKTFFELFSQFRTEAYYQAGLAAICLGLKINNGDKNIIKLVSRYKDQIKSEKMDHKGREWLRYLEEGKDAAMGQKELDFQSWLPDLINLEYKGLLMRAGITV